MNCACSHLDEPCKFIVLTGGPGAGKTAVLEVIRINFCHHVGVLPEAAGILFTGGFPRRATPPARMGAQRAIYSVQTELERITREERKMAAVLCDRGTLDALAYWPGTAKEFYDEVRTNEAAELAKYATVIHLRTPGEASGYKIIPPRIESAAEAKLIDDRIFDAWKNHPRRLIVESATEFVHKLTQVVDLIKKEIPLCCQLRASSP